MVGIADGVVIVDNGDGTVTVKGTGFQQWVR